MIRRTSWTRGRLLPVAGLCLLLLFMAACAANRYVVRTQTQLQLINDDLAARQHRMSSEFTAMTQLMRHDAANFESVRDKVEEMRRNAVQSDKGQAPVELRRQLTSLQKSARHLGLVLDQMEARAATMNEIQSDLLRANAGSQVAQANDNSTSPQPDNRVD
jgi:hypothetical protein